MIVCHFETPLGVSTPQASFLIRIWPPLLQSIPIIFKVFKGLVGVVGLPGKVYIPRMIRDIAMEGEETSMKLKEIDQDIGERDTLLDPQIRRIDKYGRLHVGLENANQEVLVIYVKPRPGDKEKWVRV